MKTKINFLREQVNGMGFITSRFFIKFPFEGFLNNLKHNINRLFLQECGDFTWRVSDCEEIVGGYSQEMMGFV